MEEESDITGEALIRMAGPDLDSNAVKRFIDRGADMNYEHVYHLLIAIEREGSNTIG